MEIEQLVGVLNDTYRRVNFVVCEDCGKLCDKDKIIQSESSVVCYKCVDKDLTLLQEK